MDVNPSVHVRSTRLDLITHRALWGVGPVWGALKAGLKAVTPADLRPRVRRNARSARRRIAYGKPPPPDPQLMLELRRRFKGEVVALSEYLDRDLVSLWGYDQIG
jgi:hypothetical protein